MNKIKSLFKSISDDELSKAVEEIEESNKDGVIPDGVIRDYTNKVCEITNENTTSTHLFTVTVGLMQEAAVRWKNSKDFPFFYPLTKKPWKDVEIHPAKWCDEGYGIEVCEEGEENFWSVYLRLLEPDNTSGEAYCIADFKQKDEAEDFTRLWEEMSYFKNIKIQQ